MTDSHTTDDSELHRKVDAMIEKSFPKDFGRDDLIEATRKFVLNKLAHYHAILGFDKERMFDAMEKRRNYWAANFYQEANFPSLDGVTVLETTEDAKKLCASGRYKCPSCDGESTDPYQCTCEGCDWKSYGLFRTLGKGMRIVVKETFLDNGNVHEIFTPIQHGAT